MSCTPIRQNRAYCENDDDSLKNKAHTLDIINNDTE